MTKNWWDAETDEEFDALCLAEDVRQIERYGVASFYGYLLWELDQVDEVEEEL